MLLFGTFMVFPVGFQGTLSTFLIPFDQSLRRDGYLLPLGLDRKGLGVGYMSLSSVRAIHVRKTFNFLRVVVLVLPTLGVPPI